MEDKDLKSWIDRRIESLTKRYNKTNKVVEKTIIGAKLKGYKEIKDYIKAMENDK